MHLLHEVSYPSTNKPYTANPAGRVTEEKNTIKQVLARVKGQGQYTYVHLVYF